MKPYLFRKKDSSFCIYHFVVNIIIFMLLMFLSSLLCFLATPFIRNILSTKNNYINLTIHYTVLNLILPFSLISILVFIFARVFEKRKPIHLGFSNRNKPFRKYLRGFVIGMILISACTLFLILSKNISLVSNKNGYTGSKAFIPVFIILFGWIIQGASEEILVRGWFMSSVGMKHNIPLAVFSSSLLFTIIHLGNSNLSVLSLTNLFIFGVFAALYSILDESIWGICGLHTTWNWFQGNVVGFEVSGANPAGGKLLDFTNTGADVLTGGSFGLEGGLTVTVVLIIGILTILYISKARKKALF